MPSGVVGGWTGAGATAAGAGAAEEAAGGDDGAISFVTVGADDVDAIVVGAEGALPAGATDGWGAAA